MTDLQITEEQRANLLRLADYLDSDDLPAAFDMTYFSEDGAKSCTRGSECPQVETCGSIGCAIGHGPYAGIPKLINEDWFNYSERVFGLINNHGPWEWCFGSDWLCVDNTREGAAARIRWLLEKGLPEDSYGQAEGRVERCYQ